MTLKRTQVVMLPTNEKANLVMILEGKNRGKLSTYDNLPDGETFKGHNLYFLSDDKIKGGNWFIDLRDKDNLCWEDIYCAGYGGSPEFANTIGKKIIATTDSSLTTGLNNCDGCLAGKLVDIHGYHAMGENGKHLDLMICQKDKYIKCLPQPSEDFIKVFVEEYNKGNIIKQVDVEYTYSRPGDCGCRGMVHDGCGWADDVYDLKVNSKNEISIRKIKNTWTREELHEIIASHQYDKGVIDWKNLIPALCKELEYDLPENWIEDNL